MAELRPVISYPDPAALGGDIRVSKTSFFGTCFRIQGAFEAPWKRRHCSHDGFSLMRTPAAMPSAAYIVSTEVPP